MSCSRVWTTALSSVAVALSGALFALSADKTAGAVLAVAVIACVSCVWWQAWRAALQCEISRQRKGGEDKAQGAANAIDKALDGEEPDTSGLDPMVAEAVKRVAGRVDGLLREIVELSPSDELTSLAKEEVFNNVLWREFTRATRYGKPLSVALVEIEVFEGADRQHGSQAGREVTRHVASVILQMVRETDLAAKYGEDRFAVIMPETGQEGAMEFAGRLSRAVREGEFKADGGTVNLGVTVGVASVPSQDIKTAPDLVKKAAAALSNTKERAGR